MVPIRRMLSVDMEMYEKLPHGSTVKERLEAYSVADPNSGCWLWVAAVSHNGYGLLGTGPGERRTHRLSYTEFKGPIPKGIKVLHRCDTPCCVNPEHLRLGTQQDNLTDMVQRGRSCFGELNGTAKLTNTEVLEIVDLLDTTDLSQKKIGILYDVSEVCIHKIHTGKNWSSVTGRPAKAEGKS